MAKKRGRKAAHRPLRVSIRRTGGAETGAAPAPRKRFGYRGPSAALRRATGAVSSARQAANRAREVAKAEPARTAVGFVVGNGVGFGAAELIHKSAVKDAESMAGKHEAGLNALAAGVQGAVAVGAALMKGGGVLRKYVMHTAACGAAHSLGAAGAINRQHKDPALPPTPPSPRGTKGTEGGNDPFRSSGGSGAPPAEFGQRRAQFSSRIASMMRTEDPDGAGTEGAELEAYAGNVFDRIIEDRKAKEAGTGALLADLADPNVQKAILHLAEAAKGKADARKGDQTTTSAVLQVEGVDVERLGSPRAVFGTAAAIRREVRTTGESDRRKARLDRSQARLEKRKAATPPSSSTAQPAATTSGAYSMGPAADAPMIIIPDDRTMLEAWRARHY